MLLPWRNEAAGGHLRDVPNRRRGGKFVVRSVRGRPCGSDELAVFEFRLRARVRYFASVEPEFEADEMTQDHFPRVTTDATASATDTAAFLKVGRDERHVHLLCHASLFVSVPI